MKFKHLFYIILFIAGFSRGYAQPLFQKPLKSSQKSSSMGTYYLGMKVGCPWSVLAKSDLDNITYLGHWGYLGGLTAERFFQHFSLGIEACWTEKGTRMRRQSTYQVSLNQEGTITKEISATFDVINIRIPFTYYLTSEMGKGKVIPYLFVAPHVDLPMPICITREPHRWIPSIGNPFIQTTTSNEQTDVVKTPIHPSLNAGISAGTGLLTVIPTGGSTMLLKLDVGMSQGLINMATQKLKEEGVVILSQSIEASITLLFQLKRTLHDACHNFQNHKR